MQIPSWHPYRRPLAELVDKLHLSSQARWTDYLHGTCMAKKQRAVSRLKILGLELEFGRSPGDAAMLSLDPWWLHRRKRVRRPGWELNGLAVSRQSGWSACVQLQWRHSLCDNHLRRTDKQGGAWGAQTETGRAAKVARPLCQAGT